VELGAAGATEQQLIEAVRDMGLKGEDPIRKAIAFYRKAADFAELPISKYWETKQGRPKGTSPATKRTKKPKPAKVREDVPAVLPPSPPIQGSMNVPIHPMLAGAIQWLWERGNDWPIAEREMWCRNFVTAVEMVYPGGVKHRQADAGKRGRNGKKSAAEVAATVAEAEAEGGDE
jgi:hypothetical protein